MLRSMDYADRIHALVDLAAFRPRTPMSVVRLRYHTIEFGELDIHLRTLRDNQQFSDDEGEAEALGISSAFWPLFGIVWDSGNVLAHLMVVYEIVGLRILEVGCGIALASLVLNHRLAGITATSLRAMSEGAVATMLALLRGERPANIVNPQALPRS